MSQAKRALRIRAEVPAKVPTTAMIMAAGLGKRMRPLTATKPKPLIEVNGKQVQLTTTQFELMALMIKRMAGENHQPELVRGFVRSSELIADLSWDTREPSENHVKQLVRRVRRALIKSEIGDLIESRHRFGYRLRAIPRE